MNGLNKNVTFWIIIGVVIFMAFQYFQGDHLGTQTSLDYSEFITSVEQGHVSEVALKGNVINGRLSDGKTFVTHMPLNDLKLVDRLSEKNVRFRVVPASDDFPSFTQIFIYLLPTLLLLGGYILVMRQMQSGSGKALGFGRSKAKLLSEPKNRVTFADVAGVEEAKEELVEVVEFLKEPKKFQRLGGKIPRGVLLVGPPGTGKTLLARAIAGEANVPFFSISGSDFVEMFVGVGASRVRDMFEKGKKNAPCLIFIDEIDAVGRHRGAGLGGGNDEREQTLNQLLVEMDGFEPNDGVILIAATNRPDVLDPALLRPGRFDRQVVVPTPDINGREQILKVHAVKVPLAADVDLKVIARGTPGFSGADLANLINEAALLAARTGRIAVSMHELEMAKDKVMMGAERRSLAMSEEEKRITAYHEGGHALVASYMKDSDPIHKATIIPRGRALGMVMRLPEADKLSVSKARLLADLAVAMGGRVAEEISFGAEKVTTGAASDIQMATSMARRMVTEWGMSEKLGPLQYAPNQQEVFLGHSITQQKSISEATAQIIDEEVKRLVEEAYQKARRLIMQHKDQLGLIAEALLEQETLSGEEIKALIKGEGLPKPPQEGKGLSKGTKTSIPLAKRRKPVLKPEPQASA